MTIAEINRRQHEIRESLLYLRHSPRNAVLMLDRWLRQLLDLSDPALTRSFLLESAAGFLEECADLQPVGCEPVFLKSASDTAAGLRRVLRADFEDKDFLKAENALHRGLRSIEAWLGEAGACDGIAIPGSAGITERGRLEAVMELLRSTDDPLVDEYRWIAEDWDTALRTQNETVVIPLLEQEISNGLLPDFKPFGYFTALRVTLETPAGQHPQDEVRFTHGAVAGVESAALEELRSSLAAARSAAPRLFGAPLPQGLRLNVSCMEVASDITGRSLGLGAAVGALTSWSGSHEGRLYRAPGAGTVFTGRIDDNGSVVPLHDNHIIAKTRAAFYSPQQALALPKSNEAGARESLNELLSSHPRRGLALLPVMNLREVFDSRLAVETRIRGNRELLAMKLRRHQSRIAAVTSALVVLMLAGYFLLDADFDRNPVSIIVEDNLFYAVNSNSKRLWSVQGISSRASEGRGLKQDTELARYLQRINPVIDLDRDGMNEVLLSVFGFEAGVTDNLTCYNSDGTIRWRRKLGESIKTAENEYTGQTFTISHKIADQLEHGGPVRIIAVADNNYYSDFLYMLAANGNVLGKYLNLGSITGISLWGGPEGKRKILFSGRHNGFRCGILGLLDPDSLDGVSPERHPYTLITPRMTRAKELAYVRFPSAVLMDGNALNSGESAFLLETNREFARVRLDLLTLPDSIRITHASGQAWVEYTFNNSLTPISVTTSNEYDHVNEIMSKKHNGLGRRTLPGAEALMRGVSYWNGREFGEVNPMNTRARATQR